MHLCRKADLKRPHGGRRLLHARQLISRIADESDPVGFMATCLLGWERGRGGGYVKRLRRLAEQLAAQGHRPVLAMPAAAMDYAAAYGDAVAFPVVEAPRVPAVEIGRAGVRGYADLLELYGFADRASLEALTAAAGGLLAEVQPALIVAENAPALALAAYGRVPVVQFGMGYFLPPAQGPVFPTLMPEKESPTDQAAMLGVINAEQMSRGARALPAVTTLHSAGPRFVYGLELLDPYRAVRDPVDGVAFVGSAEPLPAPVAPPEKRHLYVYAHRDSEAVGAMLGVVCELRQIERTVFVPGMPEAWEATLVAAGVTVHREPQPFHATLAAASHVMHGGGFETSAACLAIGRPQLVVPSNLYEVVTGQAIGATGAGFIVNPLVRTALLPAAMQQFLASEALPKRAQEVAGELAGKAAGPGLGKVLDAALAELGR